MRSTDLAQILAANNTRVVGWAMFVRSGVWIILAIANQVLASLVVARLSLRSALRKLLKLKFHTSLVAVNHATLILLVRETHHWR